MPQRTEILAPAGTREAMAAALAAGADAIYFGLDEGFNARARAENFALADLAETVAWVHRGGARAYITFNTLVFEPELPVVAKLLADLAVAGVDAIIVQDPAVALLARQICPALHVHASTQMTVSTAGAAELVRDLGVVRVVVPRELSVDEIEAFAAETSMPLEVFVHGALCVSWSGQCLSSEAWGGRSANRGQCAQACRLPYDLLVDDVVRPLGDVKYLLSPLDLVGLDAVPRLAALGVASLKIEGRLKAPAYVHATATAYRAALDGADLEPHRRRLEHAYSRGISPGFLAGVDHQRLVEGRFPKHRGVPLGRVVEVGPRWVEVDRGQPIRARADSSAVDARTFTPSPGMGVVFDAGTPEKTEAGGPIFFVEPGPRNDIVRLGFGQPGPDLASINVGDRVWVNSDPALTTAANKAVQAGFAPTGAVPVRLHVSGAVGLPLHVKAWAQAPHAELSADATSSMPLAAAAGAGLTEALLRDKLGAFGGTAFACADLVVTDLPTGLHLPVSVLKDLRRQLVVALEAQLGVVNRPVARDPMTALAVVQATHAQATATAGPPVLAVLCRTDAQLDAALAAGVQDLELDWMELVGLGRAVAKARQHGAHVTLATTRILKPGEAKIDAHLVKLAPDAILVRSWASLAYLRAHAGDIVLHGDFSLNLANSIAARWALDRGLATVTLAHDLDRLQLEAMLVALPPARACVTIHHHIATFHTEHCVYAQHLSQGADYRTCGRPCEQHRVALRDRVDQVHPVVVDVGCRNTVFAAQAQSAASLVPELVGRGLGRMRIELVWESAAETTRVIRAYQRLVAGSASPAATLAEVAVHEQFGVTRGTMRTLTVVR